MTDQQQQPNETPDTKPLQPQQSTEAPCSANVRARIGGYDWQITCRSHTTADDLVNMAKAIKWWNTWLDGNKAQSPAKAEDAINSEKVTAPTAPIATLPNLPPAPPVVAAPAGPMNAQCVMIEVGTSYTGNKPQLKFACNGLEHPLTFTKDVNEMAKLLAPLGFTVGHMVIGQKYPVNCIVTYTESSKDGKTYKNVQSVRPAA